MHLCMVMVSIPANVIIKVNVRNFFVNFTKIGGDLSEYFRGGL